MELHHCDDSLPTSNEKGREIETDSGGPWAPVPRMVVIGGQQYGSGTAQHRRSAGPEASQGPDP